MAMASPDFSPLTIADYAARAAETDQRSDGGSLSFPLLGLFSRRSFYGPFPIELALFADAGIPYIRTGSHNQADIERAAQAGGLIHHFEAPSRPGDLQPWLEGWLQERAQEQAAPLTRDQLLDGVWGTDVYVDERTVDVHIGRLRKPPDDVQQALVWRLATSLSGRPSRDATLRVTGHWSPRHESAECGDRAPAASAGAPSFL